MQTQAWLVDMEKYLHVTIGNSEQNVHSVMRVTEKLASGHGSDYPRWSRPFLEGTRVHLGYVRTVRACVAANRQFTKGSE